MILATGWAIACLDAQAAPRTAEALVNGRVLVVGVPAGFEATAVPDGIRLRPSDADRRRSPYDISVGVEVAAPVPASMTRQRTVNDRIVRYRIDRVDGGGSGGDETALEAVLPCASGMIRLRLDTQTENGFEPDLRPVWEMLEAARCRPAR